jgi:hypothetical protein
MTLPALGAHAPSRNEAASGCHLTCLTGRPTEEHQPMSDEPDEDDDDEVDLDAIPDDGLPEASPEE